MFCLWLGKWNTGKQATEPNAEKNTINERNNKNHHDHVVNTDNVLLFSINDKPRPKDRKQKLQNDGRKVIAGKYTMKYVPMV